MGDGQLDPAEGKVEAPTDVQWMRPFHPLALKPALDLEIGDCHRAGALGNGNGIPHVVSMTMGDEDIVGSHLIGTDISQGIAGQKRVDQQLRASDVDAKASMAVIRNPHNRHGNTSQVESFCHLAGRGPRDDSRMTEQPGPSRARIIP